MLFDLDHTLLDSNTSEALAFDATMRSIGLDDPAPHLATYQSLNIALWKQVERGELSPNDVKTLRFEKLLSQLEIDADPALLGEHYLDGLGAHGELFPHALEMLDAVATFAELVLITNGIGSVQRARLQRLELVDRFSAIAISGELGMAKPHTSIFDHIFGLIGSTDRSTSIIVGDSLSSDIAGGHNAGIDTCWYNPYGTPSGVKPPTMEVRALREIPVVLAQR